jgi:hypothetical protein
MCNLDEKVGQLETNVIYNVTIFSKLTRSYKILTDAQHCITLLQHGTCLEAKYATN